MSSTAETPIERRRPFRALRSAALQAGTAVIETAKGSGGFGLLVFAIFKEIFTPPYHFRLVAQQVYFLGVKSISLVAMTGLATGSIMALQFGYGLERFGGKLYVPMLVALAVLREMGPVFTSLLLAGRIGSGIAAEVSSMQITQQIDAIRALGTSPVKRIVIPRLLAALIALPILTIFADFVAMAGAMMVCALELNINMEYFASKAIQSVMMVDFLTGVAKTIVFAFFISIVACYKGLHTDRGTQGVGNTTTWVVVASSIFIMLADFFLSKFFIITVFPKF